MKLIITLDYELFLNDITGSVENCLIKPMMEFQKVCSKYGIAATIFVDAAYLYMLNKLKPTYPELREDYDAVVGNIKWLMSNGHDIQLHIHPQWYYSKFDGGKWILDWDHYKLSDMPEKDAFELFQKSKNLLGGIIDRPTVAFRAGGYSIQGFDYVKCFKDNGIVADSSVLPGAYAISNTHTYDYRKIKDDVYRFSNDIRIKEDDGSFVEFPIASSDKVFISKYLRTKRNWMTSENMNWGDGGDYPAQGKMAKIKKLLDSFSFFKHPHASIDYQSFFWLRNAFEHCGGQDVMTIIGHPKNFSEASLKYLDSFIADVISNGHSFTTIKNEI